MLNQEIPHCTEDVLRRLYHVKDSLRRESFMEAVDHIGDALALVNNEHDWTYRTDKELPVIRDYLNKLAYTIYVVSMEEAEHRSSLVDQLIVDINTLTEKLSIVIRDTTKHKMPDETLDPIEIEHKKRIYRSNDE